MEMTLTKNFLAAVNTLLFGASTATPIGSVVTNNNGFGGAAAMTVLGGFKDTNGTVRNAVAGDIGSNMNASALQLFTFGGNGASFGTSFNVGSGTTAATVDDYTIEAPISNASIALSGQNSTNGSATFHVVVTATADISVGEIGLLKKLKTASSGDTYTVLLGRIVFDEPVVLASGESKTFDVTISLPTPA